MMSIYNFIEIFPSKDFQIIREDREFACCLWLPPIGKSNANKIYNKYPSVTTHYFLIHEQCQISNLVKIFNVEENTLPESFGIFTALERKIIFKDAYKLGIGYSV